MLQRKRSAKKEELELLKFEYKICQDGYNSRDNITEDEFSKIIQIFSIFATIIIALNIFTKVNHILHICLCIIIGITGILSMISLLIDLQSSSSCKLALRKRCVDIEKIISNDDIFKYWKVIDNRKRFLEEGILKRWGKKKSSEVEGDFFINASRLLIIIWILIVFAMLFWGDSIQLIK